MAKIKPKKKTKKKSASKPRVILVHEYFIDEIPTSLSTQQMQDRTNELSKDGWQLLIVGPYGSQPSTMRVWYQRELKS
jgi:hypothetical protein